LVSISTGSKDFLSARLLCAVGDNDAIAEANNDVAPMTMFKDNRIKQDAACIDAHSPNNHRQMTFDDIQLPCFK